MFRYAIKNLLRKKVLYVLLIVQLVFAFNQIFLVIRGYDSTFKFEKKIEKVMKVENLYQLHSEDLTDVFVAADRGDKAREIIDYIKSHEGIEESVFFTTELMEVNMSNYDEKKASYILDNFGKYHGDSKVPLFNTLIIDKGSEKVLNEKVESGRGFLEEDYFKKENENIPVLLGDELRKAFKLGEVIETKMGTIEVIGFLKPKTNFFRAGELTIHQNYDRGVFMPINAKYAEDNIIQYMMVENGGYYRVKNSPNKEAVVKNVDEELNRLGFKTFSKEGKNIIKEKKADLMNTFRAYFALGAITIFFTLSSIIITTLSLISYRKREFGILIATGGTKRDIMKVILIENSIIICISYMIYKIQALKEELPYITGEYMRNMSYGDRMSSIATFSIESDIKIILVVMAIILICSIIIILKVSKLEPKELVGGIE